MRAQQIPGYMNQFQISALMLKVPAALIHNFVDEFQIAALIARIPHEQAVSMHNMDDITNFFLNNPAGINEAIGALTVHIMINQRINSPTSLMGLGNLIILLNQLNGYNDETVHLAEDRTHNNTHAELH